MVHLEVAMGIGVGEDAVPVLKRSEHGDQREALGAVVARRGAIEPQNVEQGITNDEGNIMYFCGSAVPCSAVRYSISSTSLNRTNFLW